MACVLTLRKNARWVHLRKSNTEPIVRIIAEAQTEARADALARQLIKDIRAIVKG